MLAKPLAKIASTLLEPTVIFSYGAQGYRLHQVNFDDQELQIDMTGQTCLITGANSGIGFATARALAQRGAHVHLLCRNPERGKHALRSLKDEGSNFNVTLHLIDMSLRTSIHEFVEHYQQYHPGPIDILIHNAAVLPNERHETSEGIERTFATNTVGPFLLTHLLLPQLQQSNHAHVINISSGGMYTQKLDLTDPFYQRKPFDGVVQYAQTKRAMVILNELWAQRYKETSIRFSCMHPGWVDTPAVQTSIPTFHKWMRSVLRDPPEGADTIIWLALQSRSPQPNGAFWFDRKTRRTHIFPWTRESEQDRQTLWKLCEEHTGLSDNHNVLS